MVSVKRASAPARRRRKLREPGLGLGDVGIDPRQIAFRRHALADADLDRCAQIALAGDERFGQRDQGAITEQIVPSGDRGERDPVGGHLQIRAGRPQARSGGGDALVGGAEIEQGLVDVDQRVGALPRPDRSMMLNGSFEKSLESTR